MHPDCSNPSVGRSHAIPMGVSIKQIAEKGHVVTPRFRENGVEVVDIGVRDASRLPGSASFTKDNSRTSNLRRTFLSSGFPHNLPRNLHATALQAEV
jgi:hypothetical protein